MTMLISQMIGCLIVAAGIGALVGWLVRNLSMLSLEREFAQLRTTFRAKEQALETAHYELKVKTSALQMLENKVIVAEELARAAQKDVAIRNDRLSGLQEELATNAQRISVLEEELSTWHRQATDSTATATEQADHVASLTRACQDAQEEAARSRQELADQQLRLAELEHALAATDHLHSRIQELEPAQGRVHWLEVQLSEKDMHHRTALQNLEHEVTRRDQMIRELQPLRQEVHAQSAQLHQWEQRYASAMERHAKECTSYEERLGMLRTLEAQLAQQAEGTREKERQIRSLRHQLDELDIVRAQVATHAKLLEGKEEEISRMRKRLLEVRTALRLRTDSQPSSPRSIQVNVKSRQTKALASARKDNLKKIGGIGPAYERVLNQMGIFTFRTIAQWDTNDMTRIADKLETPPDHIKRYNWIAKAKKEHFRKYGERL